MSDEGRAILLDLAGEIRLRMESCPQNDLGRSERYGYEWVMEQISKRIEGKI